MITQRDVMMAGFARVLSAELLAALDELVPTRPWREVVPAGVLLRADVREREDIRGRHELYVALCETIGEDAAAATLEYLPPVPWRVLVAAGSPRPPRRG